MAKRLPAGIDTSSVRRMYRTLRESLRRELEDEKAEPLPETTALFQELTELPHEGPVAS